MAKNNLTLEQDYATRVFYTLVVGDESLFPSDPVGRRDVASHCRRLLGYGLIDGKHVGLDRLEGATYKFGQKPDYEDEWEEDTRRSEDETNKGGHKNKANSGKSSKNTPLWKALLSKDV